MFVFGMQKKALVAQVKCICFAKVKYICFAKVKCFSRLAGKNKKNALAVWLEKKCIERFVQYLMVWYRYLRGEASRFVLLLVFLQNRPFTFPKMRSTRQYSYYCTMQSISPYHLEQRRFSQLIRIQFFAIYFLYRFINKTP